MKYALEVRDLNLSFNNYPVFKGFNLVVPSMKVTALVGPSGCGKTSLLLSINRIIETISSSHIQGEISFLGRSVFSMDVQQLRKEVGMIFQSPDPFPFSIRKNFHVPLKEHGVSRSSHRDEIMEEKLKEVGLWDEVKKRLDEPASELSGGQKQRLCIARALSLRPSLLLMDEPCSSLDPISTEVIEALITRIKREVTVLIVTHNIGQAKRVSDHLAVCWVKGECGVLEETGETQEMFCSPKSKITSEYLAGIRG